MNASFVVDFSIFRDFSSVILCLVSLDHNAFEVLEMKDLLELQDCRLCPLSSSAVAWSAEWKQQVEKKERDFSFIVFCEDLSFSSGRLYLDHTKPHAWKVGRLATDTAQNEGMRFSNTHTIVNSPLTSFSKS